MSDAELHSPLPARGTDTDVIVVGAGIVGLATARALARRGADVTVLDKEPLIAAHQSGHNSGVIHSGIYYRPGTAKARLVADGRTQLLDLCVEHAVAHQLCGKVVVATSDRQLGALRLLESRAAEHRIATTRLTPEGLRRIEPHAAGLAALSVPGAGVVDFTHVCAALQSELEAHGGRVVLGATVARVDDRDDRVVVETAAGSHRARAAVVCAGLQAGEVARASGLTLDHRIVAFRGEYHDVEGHSADLVHHLVYPVPDLRFPFLGVHITRGVEGTVHAGPNAVLALAREGYRWRDVEASTLRSLVADPAVRALARRYGRTGLAEMARSWSKAATLHALRRLVPDLRASDLRRASSGVRAQAITDDGALVDDFVFADGRSTVHVVNAPSPAATASLAIGAEIAGRLLARIAA